MIGWVLKRVVIVSLLVLGSLELVLSLTDPLGMAYLLQIGYINDYYVGPAEAGWIAPGTYNFGAWSATVANDTTRQVQSTGQECRVVFFGDSITFGWGVNDDDTFVQQLAQQWTQAQWVNAGIPGYNSAQVRARVAHIPYDVAYYLVFDNDASAFAIEAGQGIEGDSHHWPGFGLLAGQWPALGVYARYFMWREQGDSGAGADVSRFADDLQVLVDQGVQLVAFDGGNGDWVAARYPVQLIPRYTSTVSPVDPHPDAAAHIAIAQVLIETDPCQI